MCRRLFADEGEDGDDDDDELFNTLPTTQPLHQPTTNMDAVCIYDYV